MADLAKWGWDPRWMDTFAPVAPPGTVPGRVTNEQRGSYSLATGSGEVTATIAGRFRHEAQTTEDYPAVGDWVAVEVSEAGQSAAGVIRAVLPRLHAFSSAAAGRHRSGSGRRRQRRRGPPCYGAGWGLQPETPRALPGPCLVQWRGARHRAQQGRPRRGSRREDAERRCNCAGRPHSGSERPRGTGFDALTPLLDAGKTVALIGSSGVGKSTIVNHLLGFERQATSAVRDGDQRGRHTTTSRELVATPGGTVLLDSPGMRSVGMWEADEGLADAFADISALAEQCRFSDCTHAAEPGCAVQAAISVGTLPAQRLASQQKLARESAAMARRLDPQARAGERAKWKAIHKSVRNHMKVKYGPES